MSEVLRPRQRAERAVNRWLDHMGCAPSQEFTTHELQALRHAIEEQVTEAESRLAIAVEALRDIASEPGESASFGLGARCKRMAEKALALVP